MNRLHLRRRRIQLHTCFTNVAYFSQLPRSKSILKPSNSFYRGSRPDGGLTTNDLDDYKIAFALCDIDRSGFVSKEELKITFSKLKLSVSDDDLHEIFETFGESRPGKSDNYLSQDGMTQLLKSSEQLLQVEQSEISPGFLQETPSLFSKPWFLNKWTEVKSEALILRRGFSIFGNTLSQAWRAMKISLSGIRSLEKQERKIVWVAVQDFFKLVPFIVIISLPAGLPIAAFVGKAFPSILPSSFKQAQDEKSNEEKSNENDRLEKLRKLTHDIKSGKGNRFELFLQVRTGIDEIVKRKQEEMKHKKNI